MDVAMPDQEIENSTRGRWLSRAAILVALAAGMALMVWRDGAERRAIRALPEVERHALYTRTLETLATACASSVVGLRDYCTRQAQLALEFPECDQSCEALAGKQVSRIPQER
jgi:hypothetical protein